jgi:hypothetical protein
MDQALIPRGPAVWAALAAGRHHPAYRGLCGCFGQHPARPGALLRVLSLSLVLAGPVSLS